ncbi:MAG: glucosaminidase domain-containing protein [Candidatus Aenigmarchaeota archaeon]|nr:glucosaminidase domain-containing protein [Candidatus Aenigmarchaeota archaeon]
MKKDVLKQIEVKYNVEYDSTKKKFKIPIGKKSKFSEEFNNAKHEFERLESVIANTGGANVDTENFKSDKVTDALLKKYGFSKSEMGYFSAEDRARHEESRTKATGEVEEKAEKDAVKKSEEMSKTKLGKAYEASFGRIASKTGHHIKTVVFSLFLLTVGIAASVMIGNQLFMWGFVFLSLYIIFPNPSENKMVEDHQNYVFGSFLATRENRTNVGISFIKAVCRIGFIVCFVLGLYNYPFPMSNLILLLLVFFFYFSMPIEFEPSKPYDFILSIFRALFGLWIAITIFGLSKTGGIFHSPELGYITLAFFVVLPVATEKNNIARALGLAGKGSGMSYEMIDKIIFMGLMLWFAIGYGVFTATGLFTGTGGTVFLAVWIIGVIAGLTTPAETRPWMGVVLLVIGFVVFGLGMGDQYVGSAFFGQWWPTVHNTLTEALSPIGDMFGQFQNTFGQGWLLFANPVGYAQQITQGTYAQNELGVTGAYGLEIRKFDVQSIYLDEPFMIEIELENKGVFKARNINVELMTYIPFFRIGKDADSLESESSKMKYAYKDKYEKLWYKYMVTINGTKLNDIERQDALPIFLVGKMSCADFQTKAWSSLGMSEETEKRSMYIPFIVNISYDYESTSNLQIDIISNEEWNRLSAEDKLVRGPKLSIISSSPANLNLGSMDQPIKAGSPFFVGFNLTTTWPQKTAIIGGKVNLNLPSEFGMTSNDITCTGKPSCATTKDDNNCTFNLEKSDSMSAFCSYTRAPSITVPKKTYTVTADAIYKFAKWESMDTLINFKDVCMPRKGVTEMSVSETVELDKLQESGYTLTAGNINNYLSTNGFNANLASTFYSACVSSNIDPAFAVAVAQAETQIGKTGTGTKEEGYNLFGIKSSGQFVKYSKPEESIDAFCKLIRSEYVNNGQNTVDRIGCAPASGYETHCYCWENGPCSNWLTNIPSIRSQVQATPAS